MKRAARSWRNHYRKPGVRGFLFLTVFSAILGSGAAQSTSLDRGPHRLEIVVEKLTGSDWQSIDPRTVLDQNDRIRFRVTPNFGGYLHVMNQSTSGDYTRLFPSEETGQQNWIIGNQEYLVPSMDGAFRVTGPAGHEVVYWVVSPVDFGPEGPAARPEYNPLPPPPRRREAPPSLLPRCDDTILRARGDCVDTSAGPKAFVEGDPLPDNLGKISNANSRQLLFVQKKDSSVVTAPPTLDGPVVFEFRLAHR